MKINYRPEIDGLRAVSVFAVIFYHANFIINEVKNYILSNNVTTSYKSYEVRSNKSFKTLNDIDHKNLFRVFLHKIFCDYNKGNVCFIHNKKNIFYFYSEHLSVIGSKMLEKPILKIINEFE